MSFSPAGSAALPLTATLVPSTRTAPTLTIDGVGAALFTLMVCSAEAEPPSSSETVRTMR